LTSTAIFFERSPAAVGLSAELAVGSDLARHARHLGRKWSQLIDHRIDGVVFCEGDDAMIRVNIVDCNQDMSGKEVVIRGRPYNPGKDGEYHWGDEHTDSTSLSAQSAKFVCNK
jgi:hypothetical protein